MKDLATLLGVGGKWLPVVLHRKIMKRVKSIVVATSAMPKR
jgi:hypothetical protein